MHPFTSGDGFAAIRTFDLILRKAKYNCYPPPSLDAIAQLRKTRRNQVNNVCLLDNGELLKHAGFGLLLLMNSEL